MDYNKIFEDIFNTTHKTTEDYIKSKLQEGIQDEIISFSIILNELFQHHHDYLSRHEMKTNKNLAKLYIAYTEGKKSYGNNIKKIIENIVKPMLEEDLSSTYSIEGLVQTIANYESNINTYRIFRNKSNLFEKIYGSKDFSKFEIKEYSSFSESNEIESYYNNILNPTAKVSDITDVKKPKIDCNINTTEIENNINFSENEKEVLFLALYKILHEGNINGKPIKLEFTEYYKITSIVSLNDISSLSSDNYKNSSKYRVLTNGIEHISDNLQFQNNLLDILIVKTKKAKLRTMTKYLSHKSNLLLAEIARNHKKNKI